MQSDNQHIDDFFKTKSAAFMPDTSHMHTHWQRLKTVQAKQLLQHFYNELDKEEQIFTVQAEQEAVVVAKEGTRLQIPANCFSDKNGLVKGAVQITLQEFYTYPDLIAARLSTTSENRQLVTGGMLYLKATANGEELVIAPQKTIWISMPALQYDEKMMLFTGVWQGDRSQINWIPAGQRATTLPPKQGATTAMSGRALILKIEQHLNSSYNIKKPQQVQQGNASSEESESPTGKDLHSAYFFDVRKWLENFTIKKVPKTTYRFTIYSLGWINSDRYFDHQEPTISVTVQVGEGFDGQVFSQLVFSRCPSIVYGEQSGQTIRFNNIPVNEPVYLLLTGVQEGELVYCMHAVYASANEIKDLAFHPITPEQFKLQLNSHFSQTSKPVPPGPGMHPGSYS